MEGYIGLPFLEHGRDRGGMDCWGLVCVFYWERFSIRLPDLLTYNNIDDFHGIEGLFREESKRWIAVAPNQVRIGDVLVYNIHGQPVHVAVYVGGDRFLHIMRGINSCVERMSAPRWVNRLEGIYRYVG